MKSLKERIRSLNFRHKIGAARWIVFLIDSAFAVFAILVATLLVTYYGSGVLRSLFFSGLFIFCLRIASFLLGHTYYGIVRYTGARDIIRIIATLTIGELILLGINFIVSLAAPEYTVSFVFLWLEYSILLCSMVFSRLVFRSFFADNFKRNEETKNIIVYGQSDYLILARHMLHRTIAPRYVIKAFIDTDARSEGKTLMGIMVYKPDSLDRLLAEGDVDCLIIAQKLIRQDERRKVIDLCMEHKVKIKEIPEPQDMLEGSFSLSQLRNINIEDLLQRDVIQISEENLNVQIKGKVVMVTGAAGSIGSEIVRQLTHLGPAKIVLVDIAESPLYDLELELLEEFKFTDFAAEMSNIRNYASMERLFKRYRPSVVYHAAAYKHVPMIEKKPLEGLRTNVFGTRNLADLAIKYDCDAFVMVSTDKAVNPTNVMGCTKRIAEIYIQSLNKTAHTVFITTRFGNVLGSNGSVVPRFVKQIEAGGPVTVTHPEITRFFMTIPEACQLVLQAGALGRGGEIFVFDMGESVKITDLARKMIRLAGLEEGYDIKIAYTGLRPGEKLYEELLNDEEHVLPTPHKRIHRAKVREYDIDDVSVRLHFMHKIVYEMQDEQMAIEWMKILVPEFKSENSAYEKLDQLLENEKYKQDLEKKIRSLFTVQALNA